MFLSYYTPLQFYRAHVQRVCELCFHVAVNHKFEGNTTYHIPNHKLKQARGCVGEKSRKLSSIILRYSCTHTLMTSGQSLMNEEWADPTLHCVEATKTWKCQSSWMQNLWIRYKEKTVFQSSYTLVGIDPIWIFVPNLANHVICFD